MKIIITESHLKTLVNLLTEDIRPLQKLMECKITKDFKYILYDGKFYSTKTGNEVTLNEGWLTNTLRTGADMLSMGLDFVFPGTGAIVDALNALSMIIEAQFKSGAEKDSLYIMAIIQFGFILLPGALQATAPLLRNAIKTGKGLNSAPVKKSLGVIGGALNTIFGGLNSIIQRATKSNLAKRLLGKWGPKINEFVSNFKTRIKTIFDSFKTNKGGRNVAGQDLNKQNAFGTTGPIVPGQDVGGRNLKSGVGGVKRPGEAQQTNSQIVSSPQTNQDSIFQITPNQNKLPSQNTLGNQTTTNQNKLPSKTYNDDHVQIWSGPSNKVPDDYAQIWYNPKQNDNSMIVSNNKIKLPGTNISKNNIDSETFKNKFNLNYTQGDYKRNPSEVSKLLNNVNFNPDSYRIRNTTTLNNGKKAVEVITPNNGSVVLYQSDTFNGFVPISGFFNNNPIVDDDGLMKLPYIKDLMKHLNNNQNQILN